MENVRGCTAVIRCSRAMLSMNCTCCRWVSIYCRRWRRRDSTARASWRPWPIPAAVAGATARFRPRRPPISVPLRKCSISPGSPMRSRRKPASFVRAAARARDNRTCARKASPRAGYLPDNFCAVWAISLPWCFAPSKSSALGCRWPARPRWWSRHRGCRRRSHPRSFVLDGYRAGPRWSCRSAIDS
jgi:hypothetical protein